MVDPRTATQWGYRTLFLALSALIIVMGLLPLTALPQGWPLPEAVLAYFPDWLYPHDWPGFDMLLCLSLVWVLRRPDFVPILLLAAVFLIEDLLSYRPPGLWPAIVLLGTEFLRSRESAMRALPFWSEWVMVAMVVGAMFLAQRLVLALFMVPQVALGAQVLYALTTIAAYPVLALAMHYGLGLYRAAPGEVDPWGQRL